MSARWTERAVTWRAGHDPEFIYVADVDGARWTLRLGDFPDEPLYTLHIAGAAVLRLDDWPPAWRRPPG